MLIPAGHRLIGFVGLLVTGLLASATLAASLQEVEDFGDNPGELDLFVYAPDDLGPGAPLVVALHGCTQEAADFDDETGLTALADDVPFVLLMPQQRDANNARRCFNFFARDDNRPDLGESGSIMAMVDTVEARFATDPTRVYVLGLSAGGAMTAVMLANQPERFAGGAIIAGAPYGCNRPSLWGSSMWWWLRTFMGDAAAASYSCGIFGNRPVDRTAEDWAIAVRTVAGTPDSWPLVSIWQGEADGTVHPANRQELIEQWTALHDIDAEADVRETVDDVERLVFADETGTARVEAWRLPNFGHSVPIDAEAAPVPCGSVAPHIEDIDLCAVRYIARFWGLVE